MNLLNYLSEHQEEIESQYRYLDKMEKEDKERFINDYLHEDMLYSCSLKTDGEKIFTKNYSYQDWKEGKVKMEECINLEFAGNDIGNGLTIAISEIKLKEGVKLNLSSNRIGDRGIKAIAQDLELKEGVELDLRFNEIGDEGAQALIDNMELKRGTILNLRGNNISEDMKLKLKEWEIYYRDRGILCQVLS